MDEQEAEAEEAERARAVAGMRAPSAALLSHAHALRPVDPAADGEHEASWMTRDKVYAYVCVWLSVRVCDPVWTGNGMNSKPPK